MADNVKVLRKQLEKRQVQIDDETVVVFEAHLNGNPNTAGYTYAAIWLEDTRRWWVTGEANSLGQRKFTSDQFLDMIAGELITDVRVATGLEEIKE